jgi:hypothetical protein
MGRVSMVAALRRWSTAQGRVDGEDRTSLFHHPTDGASSTCAVAFEAKPVKIS